MNTKKIDVRWAAPSFKLGGNNYHHFQTSLCWRWIIVWSLSLSLSPSPCLVCENKPWLACQTQLMITLINFNNGPICFMLFWFGYWLFFTSRSTNLVIPEGYKRGWVQEKKNEVHLDDGLQPHQSCGNPVKTIWIFFEERKRWTWTDQKSLALSIFSLWAFSVLTELAL